MLEEVSKNSNNGSLSDKDFIRDSKFGFNFVMSLLISEVSAAFVNAYDQLHFANTYDGGRWFSFFDFQVPQVLAAFLGILVWIPFLGLGMILFTFACLSLQSAWRILRFRLIWLTILLLAAIFATISLCAADLDRSYSLLWYSLGQGLATLVFVGVRHLLRFRK